MKVKDIMTTELKTCTPDTTVAEAAHLMWDATAASCPSSTMACWSAS
jgi:CBS domain-containing protein